MGVACISGLTSCGRLQVLTCFVFTVPCVKHWYRLQVHIRLQVPSVLEVLLCNPSSLGRATAICVPPSRAASYSRSGMDPDHRALLWHVVGGTRVYSLLCCGYPVCCVSGFPMEMKAQSCTCCLALCVCTHMD
ncbi:hypothetical protein JZ751_005475 [Albula glossodonta]|uniref:Uncharacterized protein n=1 Tax=Albula glossodonta TaxID=121402 RepID=A0A8T2MTS0_9TELE|nr:hypothetical protein JZ751_005475 [Albula glossodonta]